MINFKGIQFAPDFTSKSKKTFQNAQNYVDSECIRLMEDYVPVAMEKFPNRGKMSRAHKVESPGVIINTEPRARREYYTNKGRSGGKRGKRWLERMKADHGDDILKGLKKQL